METGRKILLAFITFAVISALQEPVFAITKSYVVYLGGHSHGPNPSLEDYKLATESHHNLLASFLGSEEKARSAIFYSYKYHINGFAAHLEEEEALQIKSHPEVLSVIPNVAIKLHTTHSWTMVDLERNGRIPHESIWAKAKFGKDTIIANLDTGVWPESKSFADKGMGPVPSRWKGKCQNNTKEGVPCNRKLIGAQYFDKGYIAANGKPPAANSPRDVLGHGTHTLSTAGGRFVPGASLYGQAKGTAKGGSPSARVAAYKVCYESGCYNADILAGFDAAIHDGVDVISVSLGGGPMYFLSDLVAIGSFHAAVKGITVVCSAGNSGPHEGLVTNMAPWILTVAASTVDREISSILTLGNKTQLKGASAAATGLPAGKFYPIIDATDAKADNETDRSAHFCFAGSLDPSKVKGKIVVCHRGDTSRVQKGMVVLKAGGVGMVLANRFIEGDGIVADAHLLPATSITYTDALALEAYMNSTKAPVGAISAPKTKIGVKPAPSMADFSSRGPSLVAPQILKPDVTAPGVEILAAYSEGISPSELPEDKRRLPYILMSGTSMACPHVSGVAALLRAIHPDWSPAAIRSAIMTTARTRDNTGSAMKDYDKAKATPFAYGAGHIRPNRAMDPGLVYDSTVTDYLNFLCSNRYNSTQLSQLINHPFSCPSKPIPMEDLNYPSIAAPNLNGTQAVTRTVKNVGSPGTYKVRVEAPNGISVKVTPNILKFEEVGEEKVFTVSLKSHPAAVGVGYVFGRLTWTDGKHYVRSSLAVQAINYS